MKNINNASILKCCKISWTCSAWINRKLVTKVLHYINNTHSKSLLINIYATSKSVADLQRAKHIFDSITDKNTVLVNTMMKCYINHHQPQTAISLFEKSVAVKHDDVSNISYLKACIDANQYEKGNTLIEQIKHMHERSIEFVNTIIDFYGKYGKVNHAAKVFDAIPIEQRTVVTVGAMMSCYHHNVQYQDAIDLFESIHTSSYTIQHDDVLNMLYLKACTNGDHYDKGKAFIDKYVYDLSLHNVTFLNSMIDFYGYYGEMENAQNVFNLIPNTKKDIVAVGAMMSAYINWNLYQKAMDLYESVQVDGKLKHDDVSNLLYLKACVHRDEYTKGVQVIDACLAGNARRKHSTEFFNAVIDFYGNFGQMEAALDVFESMPKQKKNIASFCSMMNAYNMHEEYEKCLDLFHSIEYSERNAYCYCIALNASAGCISPTNGLNIIWDLSQTENSEIWNEHHTQAAIIRFYAKMRQTDVAVKMFDEMDEAILSKDKDGVIYQAILDCYGKMGEIDKMLQLFDNIKKENQHNVGNEMYSIVLSGCAHSGDVEHAKSMFQEMQNKNVEISPQIITAMVDCFARTDNLNDAECLYAQYMCVLNVKCKFEVLLSILSGCRIHNDVLRAERIFAKHIEQDLAKQCTQNSSVKEYIHSAYTLMGNIYAQNSRFEESNSLRAKVRRL